MIYLETNVFIKAVEGIPDVSAPPRLLIDTVRKRPKIAVTSEITLAEVLAPPRQPDAMPLHMKKRVYLDLLVWNDFIALVPVDRALLIETADLRTETRLRLPDAIHFASAVRSKCRFFVSADDDFKTLPDMTTVKPDASGIEGLLRDIA